MAKDTKRRRLDAEEVLADRVRPRPSIEDLAELIQRTNQTGLDLAPAEEKRRYRVKAALQSLLLRRHPDLVRVTSVDGEVLEISLTGTGRHAAHVPLDELDEDMRSWARRVLDGALADDRTGSAPGAGGRREKRGPLDDARLARARGAFDDARALLTRALAESKERAVRTKLAAELLDLLVDTLWDDASALTLGQALEAELLVTPSVRAAIALAAARSGDVVRARELLPRAKGLHAGAAWAELGVRALAAGDVATMPELASELVAHDPAHPVLVELRAAVASHRANEAERAEQTFGERLSSMPADQHETAARAHQRRWPRSLRARAVLDAITSAQRDARIQDLLARAEHEPKPDTRLGMLRSARAEGASGLDASIEELAVLVAATAREAARVKLVDDLRAADAAAALTAWLRATDEQRALVELPQGRARIAELGLAAVELTSSIDEAVRVALVCSDAEQALGAGSAARAAAVLDASTRVARGLARSLGIDARIGAALAASDAKARGAAIELAQACLESGDAEGAARALGGFIRAAPRDVVDRIERARSLLRLRAEHDAARSRGDLPTAYSSASALLAGCGQEERPEWTRVL